MEKAAFPLLSVAVPNKVAPFLNVTVPVGVPVPGATAATVAVKVTDCPNTDGLCDETTVVELAALFTVWASAGEVLVRKAALPL